MIAYPFSGIPQQKYIHSDTPQFDEFTQLIHDYCNVFGIIPDDIKIKSGGKNRAKVYNGVHIDNIRMALNYYILDNSSLTMREASILTGYSDHSMPSRNRVKVRAYLKNNDATFMPYWEKLLQVA